VAYNNSLGDALRYCALQTGSLSASTVPTSTQATALWDDAAQEVEEALLAASLSTTLTASSFAERWATRTEALLTGAAVMTARAARMPAAASPTGARAMLTGTSGGSPTDRVAQELAAKARAALDKLDDAAFVQQLLANGATASAPAVRSDLRSFQTEFADPDFVDSPGPGGDMPYAEPPVYFDGELR